jgi:glycosyltransferase involved in cell wall biosynthesis
LTTPVRIAFCITELEPGGAERCLAALVSRLDRRRFDPVVYCLAPRPADNPTSPVATMERAAVPVHFFGARHVLQFPFVLARLRRQLTADAPDIVQSFLFHANVLAALAGRRAGVRHIVSGIRVAERQSGWHLALARWSDRWIERHVCVSRSVQDFSRAAGLSPDKLVVIPNGVDVERFASAKPCPPETMSLAPGRRAIVSIGRLDVQKGFDWLLECMPRIFARLPDHDLVLVGSGADRRRLERLAEQMGVSRRVHFLGYRQDVAEILARAELFVLSSRWEGMPNVVLEAMAAGKPIVATDVEGLDEALGPQAAPQTVPIGDSEAFINKVVAIQNDASLAAHLANENQRRARECFSLEAMVCSYERFYESLLREPV